MPAGRPPTVTRVFGVYAALSAVPVVAIGGVLALTYHDGGQAQGLAQGRAQAAVIEEMALSPALSGDDLSEGISPDERRRLSMATDLAVYRGSVLRLRLRDFDGRVVYSDDGRDDEVVDAAAPAFRRAALGATTARVVQLPTGPAVRVLRPVMASASGRSTGVLEIYLPYADIAAAVEEQVERAWRRLLVGLVLLYGVLAAVSWSTSRSLREHAARREHEALHDPLTGLPNRALFQERAERALAEATDADPVALVLVDLDRFKHVNDTLGHLAGDQLLQVVARRLSAALRTDDTVARLGGDEFGIVLPGVVDEQTALQLVEQVRSALAEELRIGGVVLSVEASMGIAVAPRHGHDVEELLRRADAAMYRGKRGSRPVVLAEPDAEAAPPTCLSVHAEVRQALDDGQLVLHYQPKRDLASGRTVGVEALVRWQHPVRGLLGPHLFLPAVEQSDLVGPFTSWVLRRAVQDLQEWTAAGAPGSVAVTVSARNLETEGFAREVAAVLSAAGVPAGRLLVEVTETSLASDAALVAACVHELADAGVRVSIDDFGTGWSSLTQLRELPVSEVKIDRSFVRDLDDDEQDRALVRSVVDLAHGLACRVVAEGVESERTAAWLRSIGCDEAQGFLWSRPVPWQSLLDATTPDDAGVRRLVAPAPRGGDPVLLGGAP